MKSGVRNSAKIPRGRAPLHLAAALLSLALCLAFPPAAGAEEAGAPARFQEETAQSVTASRRRRREGPPSWLPGRAGWL